MNNNPNITVGNTRTLQDISKNLIPKDNKNINIVKTRLLEPGEHFSGLVYVRRSNYRRNKNNPNLYDLYFQCIDGDGVVFRAAMFSTDKKESVKNEIMYINKGMAVEQLKTGIVYYNIENITKFIDYQVPITAFIKEIPAIEQYYTEVLELIEELKKDEILYALYSAVETKYNYMRMLRTVPYKDNLGTKLGSTLKVIRDMCKVYHTLHEPQTIEQLYEYRLFILSSFMAFLQQSLVSYSDINFSKDVNENFISETLLPISEELLILIYETTLKRIDRAKLLSILNNSTLRNRNEDIQGKFPLEITFFNILDTVEKNLSVIEMLESKDIENKRHPSGVYIV